MGGNLFHFLSFLNIIYVCVFVLDALRGEENFRNMRPTTQQMFLGLRKTIVRIQHPSREPFTLGGHPSSRLTTKGIGRWEKIT